MEQWGQWPCCQSSNDTKRAATKSMFTNWPKRRLWHICRRFKDPVVLQPAQEPKAFVGSSQVIGADAFIPGLTLLDLVYATVQKAESERRELYRWCVQTYSSWLISWHRIGTKLSIANVVCVDGVRVGRASKRVACVCFFRVTRKYWGIIKIFFLTRNVFNRQGLT